MKIFKTLIFFSFFISFSAYSNNFAVFSSKFILNNLDEYKIFLNDLDKVKESIFNNLKLEKNILLSEQKEIEDSKLLLNNDEYLSRLSQFDEKKNIFNQKIEKYNNYLSYNLEINERIIYDQMIDIVKDIASERNIDLIFNENQYFIASNDINISNNILEKFNNLTFNLKIVDFENYE